MENRAGRKQDESSSVQENIVGSRQPAPFLVKSLPLLPRGHVLDVAAGSGRNTLYLAKQGFTVHALDRDPDALQALQAAAHEQQLSQVTVEVVDLEGESFPTQVFPMEAYDVVIVCFYLLRPLFPALLQTLKPGGVLLYETFLLENYERYRRPRHPVFCLQPHELRTLAAGLQILQYDEAARAGKEGRQETFTARLLARKESR
ncbi:MAG: class I SAM-dependent methyltransferase [Candidatus Binatia bacterium]